jgi:hypothetical protein
VIRRYAKAIGALIGGITPAILIGILAAFGVHIDATVAAGICTVLATVATYLAPANTPAPLPAGRGPVD